jgi:hypothetical protein
MCVNEVGKAALWAQTFLPDSVNFYREPLMFCEETEELTTGTNNDKYGEEFQLYPVPCHDLIKIQFNKNNDWNKLIVLNTDGKTILDQEISKSCVSEIDVQKFISGIYWIKITNKYGKHFMRKFMAIVIHLSNQNLAFPCWNLVLIFCGKFQQVIDQMKKEKHAILFKGMWQPSSNRLFEQHQKRRSMRKESDNIYYKSKNNIN